MNTNIQAEGRDHVEGGIMGKKSRHDVLFER